MKFQLHVVANTTKIEADSAYFRQIQRDTEVALKSATEPIEDTLPLLCEYIDLVDGDDLPMNKPVYNQAVHLLYLFLSDRDNLSCSQRLAAKSWAANTLFELAQTSAVKSQKVKLLPTPVRKWG